MDEKHSQPILEVWKTTVINFLVKGFNVFGYNLLKKIPSKFLHVFFWKEIGIFVSTVKTRHKPFTFQI